MVLVSKEEAMVLRKEIPNVTIVQSCRLKNNGARRGKRYAEETSAVLTVLEKLRKLN